MNLIMKTCFVIIVLILTSLISVKAQKTIATIIVSGKSFPQASSGGSLNGSNLNIQGLYVYINDLYIGYISNAELNN